MKKEPFNEDLLWDFVDGLLDAKDQSLVNEYLRLPEGQAHLAAVVAEKQTLRSIAHERPPAGFSAHVMAAWVSEQMAAGTLAAKRGPDWILLSIVGLLGLFVTIPFIALLIHGVPATTSPVLEDYKDALPRLPWEAVLNSAVLHYTLLLTVAFFGLRFLDKYLQVRQLRTVSGTNL